jgi:Fic family protein
MKYADTDIHIDEVLLKKVEEKKKRLDNLRPLPREALKKLLEDIRLRHTYHSDAIEGNTLTLQETKLVIEVGITIGGKPLKDHVEAKNDAEAFDVMITLVQAKKPISQDIIQEIHERVTRGTLEESGKYRTQNVRIAGSKTTPPSYTNIVKLMEEYISNIKELKLHSIKKAAFIHHELVRIHPFLDGNGRVSRLITNLYLMKQGYPPIVLKKEDRGKYYQVLQRADDGDVSPFANFIAQAIHEALMYYLSSFVDDERLIPLKEIADFSPYSQEYLSLRARQGKVDAVKIENVWYSSKRALKEYLKSLR